MALAIEAIVAIAHPQRKRAGALMGANVAEDPGRAARKWYGRPVRRTQTERRAESERRLLDATARLVAHHGSAGATYDQVAREAGCSRGLASYHFGTKEALLAALLDDALRQLREHVLRSDGTTATGLEALAGGLQRFLTILEGPGHTARAVYVLLGEALGSRPELLAPLNAYQRDLRAAICGWVIEGIDSGEIRTGVDPDTIAVMAVGILRGIGFQYLSDPDSVDLPSMAASIDAVFRGVLTADR